MKIMIVEDSTSMRKVLNTMLRGLGYAEVYEAEDGVEAWEHLCDGGFDLLISDWNMPNMSGLELLEKVRAEPKTAELPVIMATSRTEKEDVIKAMKAGANNYISKPFNSSQLKAKIDRVMQLTTDRKAEQEAQKFEVMLNSSANVEVMTQERVPFVLIVEKSIDPVELKRPEHKEAARLLSMKVAAFEAVNDQLADGKVRYVLEDDTQRAMRLVRARRESMRLLIVPNNISGGGITLARLVLLNHKADCKVCLIVDTMFEFSVTERSTMSKMGVVLLERGKLNPRSLEQLYRENAFLPGSTAPDTPAAAREATRVSGGENAWDQGGFSSDNTVSEKKSPSLSSGDMRHDTRQLEADMGRNSELPSVPLFYDRVQKIARDLSADSMYWVDAVESDPCCEAMVIDRARASVRGARDKVEDIKRAVELLGKEAVRDIAAAAALNEPLEAAFDERSTVQSFWRHSVSAGFTARMLMMPFDGRKLGEYQQRLFDEWSPEGQVVAMLKQFNISSRFALADGEVPFVGGLMHDMGHVAVASTYPEQFDKVLSYINAQEYKISVHAAEMEIAPRSNHALAGTIMAHNWEMGQPVENAIRTHHDPEPEDEFSLLISLADFIAGAADPFPQDAPYPHVLVVESLAGAMNPIVELDDEDREALMAHFVPTAVLEHINTSLDRVLALAAIMAPGIKRMTARFVRSMATAATKRSIS